MHGPHHVRAGARLAPGQRVDLALDAEAQHPVHRGVVVDLVDAVAVAVVRAQHRDVALRALALLERLGEATTAPKSRTRSSPHSPPSRTSASRSARSASKAL